MVMGYKFKDSVHCLCNQSHTYTSTVCFKWEMLIQIVLGGAVRC